MRSVLLVAHTTRRQIVTLVARLVDQLQAADYEVRMLRAEADESVGTGVRLVADDGAARGCEFVIALGGDGTLLRGAELARPDGVALFGVNLGRVGFLAEAEPRDLPGSVACLAQGRYRVEERVTVDAEIIVDGRTVDRTWALNEASLERTIRERILDIAVAVDGHPFLSFGCDGVLCASPTGSTAYAFSLGGPVMWPSLDALLVVPNAAHAPFARPFVVAPDSTVDIDLHSERHPATLSCDGRRSISVPSGARVRFRRGELPVRVVRINELSFTERLVSKFQLPTRSLRDSGGGGDEIDTDPPDPADR